VHVPLCTVGALMAIVQMKKTAEGQAKQAIMAALGTEFYVKTVVVVDEDVDIFNLSDVMWAVITRTRADQDVTYIHGAMGAILDPTSDPENHTVTKVGIDATKPTGRDFAERLTITDEQRSRVQDIFRQSGIEL
jgi:2,5-furandicarboxylate decarboxylase 1